MLSLSPVNVACVLDQSNQRAAACFHSMIYIQSDKSIMFLHTVWDSNVQLLYGFNAVVYAREQMRVGTVPAQEMEQIL